MNEENIEYEIDRILGSKEVRFRNEDTQEIRNEKIKLACNLINEKFADPNMSKVIDLTPEKIEMALDNDRFYLNSYNAYDNRKFSDYDYDLTDDEKRLNDMALAGKKMVSSIASEVVIQNMDPKDITLDLIENLKYTKTVEEAAPNSFVSPTRKDIVVAPEVFYKSLETYINSVDENQIDENLLNYLYENNYHGNISNPMLACAYLSYCEGKNQENQISDLKQGIQSEEEIMNFALKEMNDLINKVNKKQEENQALGEVVNKEKADIEMFQESISRLVAGVKEKQGKGVFSKISSKIKQTFSKNANNEIGVQDFQNLTAQGSEISGALVNALKTGEDSVTIENSKRELNSKRQMRAKMVNDFYAGKAQMSEVEPYQPNIEYNEEMVNNYNGLLEEMYNQGEQGPFEDKIVEVAYKAYCKKREVKEQIDKLEKEYTDKENLMNYDGKILDTLLSKYSNLSQIQLEEKRTLDSVLSNVILLKNIIERVKENQEVEDKKGIATTLKDRITAMFSKRKGLPKGKSEIDELKETGAQTVSFIGQFSNKVQSVFSAENNLNEISQMINERNDMLSGKTQPTYNREEISHEKDDQEMSL